MAGEKKFFLGIGGQQTGPYSDQDVLDKVQSGEARPDTLVWYEGLVEWQRIDTIAYFQSAFKKSSPGGGGGAARMSGSDEPLRPVFSTNEAVFYKRRGPSPQVMVIGVALTILFGGAYWYLNDEEATIQLPRDKAYVKGTPTTRPQKLEKADSDFLLNPNVIPEEFIRLIGEDYKDDVGRKAVSQLEGIYKKKRRFRELGELYMQINRPWDSVDAFMEEKLYDRAEKAAFEAYQKSPDKEAKRKMLTKTIELLTGPLQNPTAAVARIQMLEKEFPNSSHAFGYYMLSKEKKMADLFERTSFFFVESLINHMKSEFPQLKLATRPTVSIFKEGGDRYRIAATYKGDVSLSTDKLRNISFEYWLVDSSWNLVKTNVTTEREAWAKTNRTRQRDSLSSGDKLLAYLEGVMRAQFPSHGLHEKVSRADMEAAVREIAVKK